MNKVYTRINWKNYPSENTAVNESNLNKMDYAIDELDTRVVQHETTKANVASLNNLIDDWQIDETTGVITIHKVSGEQIIFDLNLEKVPVGFSMTDDGILVMTTDDGTEFTANIGSMIPILTFQDTDEIAVSVSGEGVNKTYSFAIKTGSIAENKLQPNFLADCRLYAGNAEESAILAGEYAEQAKESAESVSFEKSHVGMIIHSTTLDTMEKVIAIYGGTSWSKLEGVFLLGQSSEHEIGTTGGSESLALTAKNIPSHNHTMSHTHTTPQTAIPSSGAHTHTVKYKANATLNGGGPRIAYGDTDYSTSTGVIVSSGAHQHNVPSMTTNGISSTTTGNTGSGEAISTMPPYKTVYIWERVA